MPSAVSVEAPARLSPWSRDLRAVVARNAAPFHACVFHLAESFRATQDEPHRQIRVAKAVAHLFATMPIAIRRGERLAGWHPSTPPGGADKERMEEARACLAEERWRGGFTEGHLAPDYPTAMRDGLGGIRRRIDECAHATRDADKDVFYRAAGMGLDAMRAFIRRYANLARDMAAGEADAEWSAELGAIADVCDHLVEGPPRTFREALQLMWFMFLCVALENGASHCCFGPGRLDQVMLPFYEADLASGHMDEATADDLLAQFFIKCNEFEGRNTSAVIMGVAGRTPEGDDATNALSFKMLEISDRVRMYFPGLDILWHADIAPDFMERAVRLLRNGKGQPAFFNSDVIVKGLVRTGVAFEHAVDHLPSTCTETSLMGRSNPNVAFPYINLPAVLLYALFGGRSPITGRSDGLVYDIFSPGWIGEPKDADARMLDPKHPPEAWRERMDEFVSDPPRTYAELHAAFFRLLDYVCDGVAEICQQCLKVESEVRPFPLLSCFIQDCIARGVNFTAGGALYNFIQPEAVGASNVVDSLAAIRTLGEEGRATLDDFRAAVFDNYEGHDALRRAILNDCPKHGNDVDWVNDLFGEVTGAWCAGYEGRTHILGGPMLPGFLGWTVWIHMGKATPATPDGRRAGASLANSLAPCTGVSVKGFPSMALSTGKFDMSRGLGGITFNARFQRDALQTEKGASALRGLVEAAMDVGLYQLQIEVTSTETLRAAQESPDDFADLFVRIGGYLVPFTLLPDTAQEEVIARTAMGL